MNCFFDSPIARCEAVGEMVLTDQTQAECAREHGCPPDRVCPLCGYFVEPAPAPSTPAESDPSGGAGPVPPATARGE